MFAIGPIVPIGPMGSGEAENAKLAAQATTTVIKLPKNTNHVHAIDVAKNTYNIAPRLTSMPIKAGG